MKDRTDIELEEVLRAGAIGLFLLFVWAVAVYNYDVKDLLAFTEMNGGVLERIKQVLHLSQ